MGDPNFSDIPTNVDSIHLILLFKCIPTHSYDNGIAIPKIPPILKQLSDDENNLGNI